MKNKPYKFSRHIARRLARWFLGFWDCPATLKKDRKAEMLNVLGISIATVGVIVFFVFLTLLFN